MNHLIDINQTDEEVLVALPGIGARLAKRIIERREIVGQFATIEDLAEVPGVSERMVEELRGMITIGEVSDVGMPSAVEAVAEEAEGTEITESVGDGSEAESGVVEETTEEETTLENEREEAAPEMPAYQASYSPPVTPIASPSSQTDMVDELLSGANVKTAALGALLGTILTLLLLLLLNGGWRYSRVSNTTKAMEALQSTLQQDSINLANQINGLQAELNSLRQEAGSISSQSVSSTTRLDTLEANLAAAQTQLDDVSAQTNAIESDIANAVDSANDLDQFLNLMRDSLVELRGGAEELDAVPLQDNAEEPHSEE